MKKVLTKKRTMSAEARRRISDGMKARYARLRKNQTPLHERLGLPADNFTPPQEFVEAIINAPVFRHKIFVLKNSNKIIGAIDTLTGRLCMDVSEINIEKILQENFGKHAK